MQEKTARPEKLNDFIGQKDIVNNLNITILSALKRNAPLDHILLYGLPGLGKTTLAQVIANEMQAELKTVMAPAIKSGADLVQILMNVKAGTILFIDEIHRLHPSAEEMLYSAMEDFKLHVTIGEKSSLRAIDIDMPVFTLIGATTRLAMLSAPLRDRFGIKLPLQLYSNEELMKVISRYAEKTELHINKDAAQQLAICSRGTPRIATNLFRRVKDYLTVEGKKEADIEIVKTALDSLGIDQMGLNKQDRRYLNVLYNNPKPIGLHTISSSISEDADSVQTTIEPYLLQNGFVEKTAKGRILTLKAVDYLESLST